MFELPVRGEIRTLGFREGSSGIFTGAIEGLYQGYRFASTTPDRRAYTLAAPDGTISLVLQQQIMTLLPTRLAEHPFANGRDPFDLLPDAPTIPAGGGRPPVRGPDGALPFGETESSGPPAGMWPEGGGPPAGLSSSTAAPVGSPSSSAGPRGDSAGRPQGASDSQPAGPPSEMFAAAGGHRGPPPGMDAFARENVIHYMEVTLSVDPESSDGIFAGATGAMELRTPNYEMAGYLVINTARGDLWLNFMEAGDMGSLKANLEVDGANSTGIYHNANGDLRFELARPKPLYGKGPYWGTLWLESPPQGR